MSSSVMLTFKDILVNRESSYTIDDLKNELGIVKDKSLISFLLHFLEDEINNASIVELISDKKGIEIIYKYLEVFVTENRYCDYEKILLRLNAISEYIAEKIKHIKANAKKGNVGCVIEHKFWSLIKESNNNIINKVDFKVIPGDVYSGFNTLIKIIHGTKNFAIVQELFVRYPDMFFVKNSEGLSVFDYLINYYIDLLCQKGAFLNDVIYYEMVLNLFLKSNKFVVDKEIFDHITVASNTIKDQGNLTNYHLDQRLILLHQLQEKLLKNSKYVKDLSELKTKYRINLCLPENLTSRLEKHFNCSIKNYVDCTKKEVITIDPIGSMDLDDGISLEVLDNNNYLVGVYVADVSSYISFNSCNDIKAMCRGETIYSANKPISPMLSYTFSHGVCSLLPENRRKTIATFFEIEPDGNIINYYIEGAIIKTRAKTRLSYEDVDRILNHGCTDVKLLKTLQHLQFLSNNNLFKNIESYSGIPFEKVEAHEIVEKFMILTNYVAAYKAKELGVPFINRGHKFGNPRQIINAHSGLKILVENLDSDYSVLVMENVISNCFSKAYYTLNDDFHEGLGLPIYARTTSPIRRYPDLVNQRLMKMGIINRIKDDKVIDEIIEFLKPIINDFNSRQIITNQYIEDYAHVLRKKAKKN